MPMNAAVSGTGVGKLTLRLSSDDEGRRGEVIAQAMSVHVNRGSNTTDVFSDRQNIVFIAAAASMRA